MKLSEITDLIVIRNYIENTRNNSAIDKDTIKTINGMLILLDRKILAQLQTSEFKQLIDYKNVNQAVEEVVKLTNIKSGLKL